MLGFRDLGLFLLALGLCMLAAIAFATDYARAQSWREEYGRDPGGTPPAAAYAFPPYASPSSPIYPPPSYGNGYSNPYYEAPPPQLYEPYGGAQTSDGRCLAIAAGC